MKQRSPDADQEIAVEWSAPALCDPKGKTGHRYSLPGGDQ